jgi:hypothetical protein
VFHVGTEVKSLIGDITPKTITTPQPTSNSSTPAAAANDPENGSSAPVAIGASSWNHAGTWEERDISELAKNRLRELCLVANSELTGFDMTSDHTAMMDAMRESLGALKDGGTGSANPDELNSSIGKLSDAMSTLRASVTAVQKLDGEAQIVLARGKKRCVYDFNISLDFEIAVDESWKQVAASDSSNNKKAKTYKGSIKISDLTAANEFEATISYKKAIPASIEKRVKSVADKLRDDIRSKIQLFEAECSEK